MNRCCCTFRPPDLLGTLPFISGGLGRASIPESAAARFHTAIQDRQELPVLARSFALGIAMGKQGDERHTAEIPAMGL